MSRPAPTLAVRVERWPIAGSFTISRGAKTEAVVVVAELSDGSHRGRGECVPYARYGETVEGVATAIEAMADPIANGLDRERLQTAMAAGAARNALDCAFWDLAARQNGRRVHELAGPRVAASRHHRLHDLARIARRDGASRRQGRRSRAVEGQARRRAGPRAHRRRSGERRRAPN